MNLEPLRAAFIAEASADEARRREEVDRTCDHRLAEARTRAHALVAKSRFEGEQLAAREARRRLGAASRRRRELQLAAQRVLVDELRLRAREEALAARGEPRYRDLLERLASTARSQLGEAAEVELDTPGTGGVVARAGDRSVDYTLPTLVDRAIASMDVELERLWR